MTRKDMWLVVERDHDEKYWTIACLGGPVHAKVEKAGHLVISTTKRRVLEFGQVWNLIIVVGSDERAWNVAAHCRCVWSKRGANCHIQGAVKATCTWCNGAKSDLRLPE
ncbi:hypothetical protein LIA77_05022 [Sarocladium implicatum]|nr:hypothetical protein LIA77_05022 [Sarocladium implicatum]